MKLLQSSHNVFLTLGIVWFVVGFVIYDNAKVWPLGFLFIIIGLVGIVSEKKHHR